MYIYPCQMDPLSIEHRCLAYHYTKLGRYSTMHVYTESRWTPSQLSIDALNTATPNLADIADIAQCTYILKANGPPSSKHRCLEYCCTKEI